MSSIVTELQQDAVNPAINVANLLRKALIVANKLKVTDFEQWIQNELNGYEKDKIPHYRLLPCDPRLNHHQSGWIPIIMNDPEEARLLSVWPCFNSVAEIERIAQDATKNPFFAAPYTPNVERDLMRLTGYPSRPMCFVSKTSLIAILDRIRTTITSWALKLEEDGIKGKGYSFNSAEKKKASEVTYHVTNFYGTINGSNIQVGSHGSVQTHVAALDLDKVREFVADAIKYLDQLPFDPLQKDDFAKRITAIETQLASPKPKIKTVTEALRSCRSILEGAAGSVIASGLIYKLGLFLP